MSSSLGVSLEAVRTRLSRACGRLRELVAAAAAQALAGVPLPPGFDEGAVAALGTNDPYQFGARVTGLVGCAWIAEWVRGAGR